MALRRANRWNREKINATPAQFRRMMPSQMDDGIRLAKFAGKRMAQHMAKSNPDSSRQWLVKDLHPLMVEIWRRKYGVPKNRRAVMLAVAWARLQKWNRRHSIYKPKPKSEPRRVWRKASKGERTRKPRAASPYTCMHGKLYYRACPQCKRDKAEAHGQLERLLAKHSKPLLRRLQHGTVNRRFWILVRRALGIKARPTFFARPAVPVPQGSRTYRNYMRRRRKAVVASFLKRNRRAPLVCAVPQPTAKRLVSEKVANSPVLCIDMDSLFHARCNRPVSRTAGVFCDVCQPRKERL
jgi:hypothetical protein